MATRDEDQTGSPGIDDLQKAHEYFGSQPWFELSLTNNGHCEIILKKIPDETHGNTDERISVEKAKEEILNNTRLLGDKFTISRIISGHHLSIVNGLQGRVWACRSAGVLFNRCNTAIKYLITSGHNTKVGTRYYLDPDLTDYLGICTHCSYQTENGEFVDMALVKIEKKDISRSQLSQAIYLPTTATPANGLKMFVPQLYKRDIKDFENNIQVLDKHGQALIRGKFVLIREKGSGENGTKYLALNAKEWPSGICVPGESGSLITSPPRDLGCQGVFIKGLAVVAGLKTVVREREDGEVLDSNFCVFTSIWTALNVFQSQGLEDLENFEFCPPMAFENGVSDQMSRTYEEEDSGFGSGSSASSLGKNKLVKIFFSPPPVPVTPVLSN